MDANEMPLTEYEQAISHIRDVVSCRVVPNKDGNEIDEIHILATTNRSPKQIVRDVETLFKLNFGLTIDHKKVSVVQLEYAGLADEGRLILESSQVKISGSTAEASITLNLSGCTQDGMATGTSAKSSIGRLLATATLDAAGKFLKDMVHFHVENTSILAIGSKKVAIVTVVLVQFGQEEELIGASLVDGDEGRSIVRATLDAINRRFAVLKTTS